MPTNANPAVWILGEEKVGYDGKDVQKRTVLSLEWKSDGVMDEESGESIELMEDMPLKELGEAELERLVRDWRRGAGSWFQRRGEAYWKERSVIRKDDVDGRTSVTKDEERVLRGGWTVMRLCRYEGWVVVRTFVGKWEELVFNALIYL